MGLIRKSSDPRWEGSRLTGWPREPLEDCRHVREGRQPACSPEKLPEEERAKAGCSASRKARKSEDKPTSGALTRVQ